LDDAPALLYAVGELSLLSSPCVAVVGSRKCSQAALDLTSRIAEELTAAGITVVSGMAFGIDARAHRAALKGPGRTIAVLATGVDVPYPTQHTELYRKIAAQGLILGELSPGTRPSPWAFPVRNRIVSGLSLGVLMVEAESEKSGSLITARLAAEQGRSVYVPAPDAIRAPYKEGTKSLLNSGAFPIWRAGDLMADLFPHLKRMTAPASPTAASAPPGKEQTEKAEAKVEPSPASPQAVCPSPSQELSKESAPVTLSAASPAMPASSPLSADEEALLSLLRSDPLSPDDLLIKAQKNDAAWSAPRLMAALMMLEVKRQVRRLSDSRYEVCA
ncbi:MAG: DNA-processing protein DprA, partial [Mailhella sp.]|nr:DNA-processing protein DprA [Mailhella sp.]